MEIVLLLVMLVSGHQILPEIPSASEMVKNGVNLGEMQIKLLQKVEELTLYVIDLKKDNESLKKRVVAFEDKQKGENK